VALAAAVGLPVAGDEAAATALAAVALLASLDPVMVSCTKERPALWSMELSWAVDEAAKLVSVCSTSGESVSAPSGAWGGDARAALTGAAVPGRALGDEGAVTRFAEPRRLCRSAEGGARLLLRVLLLLRRRDDRREDPTASTSAEDSASGYALEPRAEEVETVEEPEEELRAGRIAAAPSCSRMSAEAIVARAVASLGAPPALVSSRSAATPGSLPV
jgi:hypothetical protein